MSHGPARSLALMLSEPPVLNELCVRHGAPGRRAGPAQIPQCVWTLHRNPVTLN